MNSTRRSTRFLSAVLISSLAIAPCALAQDSQQGWFRYLATTRLATTRVAQAGLVLATAGLAVLGSHLNENQGKEAAAIVIGSICAAIIGIAWFVSEPGEYVEEDKEDKDEHDIGCTCEYCEKEWNELSARIDAQNAETSEKESYSETSEDAAEFNAGLTEFWEDPVNC